jgi:hypothetical protein
MIAPSKDGFENAIIIHIILNSHLRKELTPFIIEWECSGSVFKEQCFHVGERLTHPAHNVNKFFAFIFSFITH